MWLCQILSIIVLCIVIRCQLLALWSAHLQMGCMLPPSASKDADSAYSFATRLYAAKEGQFKELEEAIDVEEPYFA